MTAAYLLPDLGLFYSWHGLLQLNHRRLVALQQQYDRLQALEAIPLSSRQGGHDACQQAVGHILAVGLQEVWALLTDVGHQLVRFLLHCLVSLLYTMTNL